MSATDTDCISVDLRWRDADGLGHVNYASHLTLLEHARDRWLSARLGICGGAGYVVARVVIEYRAELMLSDGPVLIGIAPTRIGKKSLRLLEQIWSRDSRLTTVAEVTIVMWDHPKRMARHITPEERAVLHTARNIVEAR